MHLIAYYSAQQLWPAPSPISKLPIQPFLIIPRSFRFLRVRPAESSGAHQDRARVKRVEQWDEIQPAGQVFSPSRFPSSTRRIGSTRVYIICIRAGLLVTLRGLTRFFSLCSSARLFFFFFSGRSVSSSWLRGAASPGSQRTRRRRRRELPAELIVPAWLELCTPWGCMLLLCSLTKPEREESRPEEGAKSRTAPALWSRACAAIAPFSRAPPPRVHYFLSLDLLLAILAD